MRRGVSILKLTTAATLVAFALLAFQVTPVRGSFADSDGDGFVDQIEALLGSDTANGASTPESYGFVFVLAAASCWDRLDNDLDGLVDAADRGCADADDDSIPDDVEIGLGSDQNDDDSQPEDSRFDDALAITYYPVRLCADGRDDDGDGLVDAADPGCATLDADGDGFDDLTEKIAGSGISDSQSVPEHAALNPGSCVDGLDNDEDGAVDGADEGCVVAPNDDRADAIVVGSLPFTHTAKVVGATAEFGEPQPSCSFAEEQRETVWYQFTAHADISVLIDTSGTDLIYSVGVWREADFGLEEVACNSAFFFFVSPTANRFAFLAQAGDTYFIQVERYLFQGPGYTVTDFGRLSFRMEEVTPPANDDFASAEPIAGLPFESAVDTVAASAEPAEPNASCRFQGYPANSVWYRFAPAADAYVYASAAGTDYGPTLGVYEGSSPAMLSQVACGDSELAFLAEAGHTYYLQAAGYTCQEPEEGGAVASFCIDSRSGHLELRVETFELPSCPPAQFTMSDPTGDANEGSDAPFPIDATSVSVGFDAQYACVTVGFAPLPDVPQIWADMEIDADLSRDTGSGGYIRLDCSPPGLGVDYRVQSNGAREGLLASVSGERGAPAATRDRAYVTYAESSFTFVLPLDRIGGDNTLRFGLWILRRIGHTSGSFSDCAPNGGNITCQDGVCSFSSFHNGDVNCSQTSDSIDAVLVLQYTAALLRSLACEDGADVNEDDRIDSADVALILQLVAGLIERLPPEPCYYPPEFC